MATPPISNVAFKYQRIWLNVLMNSQPELLIPVCFKRNTSYKCSCVDSTYGQPDPSHKPCGGTGWSNQAESENKKWVLALTAPLDQEAINRYELGNFLASSRIMLISYPVSPEYTRLYETPAQMTVQDADGINVVADVGWIVQPEDQKAKIAYKEKIWNGNMYEVKEIEFYIKAVESYKVSNYNIGQKLILQQTTGIPGKKRFIPEE